MDYITIGFSTDKKDWISKVIRKITWSRFSHVVLISPNESSVIESKHSTGVREVPIENFLSRDNVELAKIYHPFPDRIWELAKAEVGKPYDDLYIYGWLFHRNWQDDKKWACCELIPAMAARTGFPIVRKSEFIKVTPQLLYMISHKLDN